jgi:urea transport system substrate-binding protein
VGILHSLTGTMAISETSVAEATAMAIEEINQQGGLLGRKIEAIVVDGRSDWPTFAREAERLITEEKVSVIFGCWTSACRKTVKPVLEKYNHLLFYPVQYEGLEQSPNIVYTGATANQQLIPAVKWCFDHLGRKFFLVGSDYVFPRTANAIIKDQIAALRGEVVGEDYIRLGSRDVKEAVRKISQLRPDVILNTINGDTNVAFFRELRAAGITPKEVPTMSFSVAEDELHILGASEMAGDYASWNYFQSIAGDANAAFVKNFKRKYGQQRVTDDPMEAGYFGVYLWAQAVTDVNSANVRAVRQAIKHQSFNAPEGLVYIDGENQHTWKTVRIGKIRKDGQFEIVWTSDRPVRPVPYPIFRLSTEWQLFLQSLYDGWGGHWANPGI